ncbi:hypothetical protein ACOMHN_005419 [Nucella lapillus]
MLSSYQRVRLTQIRLGGVEPQSVNKPVDSGQAVLVPPSLSLDCGAVQPVRVMDKLGLEIGHFARQCFCDKDKRRVLNSRRQAKESSHEARIARKQKRVADDEEQAEREGHPYLAGAH